jgi:mannose-6-phosphate isomerase class I
VAPLLHHVTLQPGEAISLPAGNLHAYIRGFALEVMKSSDNVIRAGFTSKFVNVEELLSIVDFSSIDIPVIRPDNNGHYASPTSAFDVQQLPWKHGTNLPAAPVDRILFGPVANELMTGTPEMILLPANEELELVDPDGSGGVLWVFTQN